MAYMANVLSIVIMFLIAAINALVIAIAVHLIFKIRIRRETKEFEIKKIESEDSLKEIKTVDLKEDIIADEIPIKTKIEDEKSNPPESKEIEEPKFLKYTPKGYIDPEKDIKKKTHIWR